MNQTEVSAERLARDVVSFVYREQLGRDPVPAEFDFQKKFLLDRVVTVETYNMAIGSTPEAKDYHRVKAGLEQDEVFVYDTCKFSLPPSSGLAACLRHPKGYEWWALPAFLSACRPGMTVVDVGANWGIYAIPAAKRVGPTGKVFAFEAAPENAKKILANAALNKIENIELLAVAASDRFGMAALPLRRTANSGHVFLDSTDQAAKAVEWEPVATFPLDAMRQSMGRVGLMKLDIEGGEYRVCRGAKTILKEDRPIIFMEFCPLLLKNISKVEPGDALGELIELGYGFEVLHQDKPAEAISGERHEVIRRVLGQCDSVKTHIDLRLTPNARRM